MMNGMICVSVGRMLLFVGWFGVVGSVGGSMGGPLCVGGYGIHSCRSTARR